MKNIKNFIDRERLYFSPMLKRAENTNNLIREKWTRETIRERQERISIEVFDLLNGVVTYGPFKGMQLNKETWWGKLDLGSQLLGLYEKEILDIFENIEVDQYKNFIDIGAADGYYAIGALISNKFKEVICFEQTEKGRIVINSNWERNNKPGKININGEANLESIKSIGNEKFKNALILIDIEGFEFELLNNEILNFMKESTIIIEIHNWIEDFQYKYERFLSNASENFNIEIIERVERPISKIAELRDFTDDNRLLLISERRPCLMRFIRLNPIL